MRYIAVSGSDVAELRTCAERTVQNAVAQATAIVQNLQVHGAAIEGMAPLVLTAESARAQMLFLGSRQLNAFGFFVLGSVGDAVATRAVCPVVIIRGEGDSFDADGAIVVRIDYSPDAVLRSAFEEASLRGLPVPAVLCWNPDLGTSTRQLRAVAAESRLQVEVWLSGSLTGWRQRYPDVGVDAGVVDAHPVVGLTGQSLGQQMLVVDAGGGKAFTGMMVRSVT